MIRTPHLRTLRWRLHNDHAAQLVEFAVTLPLLVVFVVGIFDFSGAYTLKQKLTNAARDAARTAASEPINDLSASVPASVYNAFWVVDDYMIANQINDCGISSTPTSTSSPAIWTYSVTATNCSLTITVNRGYLIPATAGAQPADVNCVLSQAVAGQTAVISTCVSVQYGYHWRFGRAASLLGPTPLLPSTITASALAMNEN